MCVRMYVYIKTELPHHRSEVRLETSYPPSHRSNMTSRPLSILNDEVERLVLLSDEICKDAREPTETSIPTVRAFAATLVSISFLDHIPTKFKLTQIYSYLEKIRISHRYRLPR